MRCQDVMQLSVFVCETTDTAARAAGIMRHRNVGFLPVIDPRDDRLVGVITDRDLVLRVMAEARPLDTSVEDVMTPEPIVCGLRDDLRSAEDAMATARKSRMPVVDEDGRCVGVISIADIAQIESARRAGEVMRAVTVREAVHTRRG